MNRHCLIAVLLVIILVGCTAPTSEKPVQNTNVTPEGVRITPDVVYGHKFGMALTFDVYQPKNQNGAGVILINSGGWQSPIVNLHKQTAEGLRLLKLKELETTVVTRHTGETVTENMRGCNIEPLLSQGFTVFNVRHGSVPKFKIDEIVLDLRRAVRFIRFHSNNYGIDAEKIGLWGLSAGGHLALLIGTTANIGISEATEAFEKVTGDVAAVVAYYPPNDLRGGAEALRKQDPNQLRQLGLDIGDDKLRDFSPINFASNDDPPTLIIHGDNDQVVPVIEGESMYQALQEAGVESKFVVIPGAGHGFEGEDADRASAEAVAWFEEHLSKK
jgi:dienelactone hydrolase